MTMQASIYPRHLWHPYDLETSPASSPSSSSSFSSFYSLLFLQFFLDSLTMWPQIRDLSASVTPVMGLQVCAPHQALGLVLDSVRSCALRPAFSIPVLMVRILFAAGLATHHGNTCSDTSCNTSMELPVLFAHHRSLLSSELGSGCAPWL